MNGILIFASELYVLHTNSIQFSTSQAGLFSAIVTAFLMNSYKSLQPDSGDAMIVLLIQISGQLATVTNGSQPASSILASNPSLFTPKTSALYVNALWFLSLGFSLACALAATLVEQWTQYYSLAIQRRPVAHKRARIRAYLYEGLQTYGMGMIVKGIPTLLHISLFLFCVGLVVFLFPISKPISYLSLGILVGCSGLYSLATLLPILSGNCPYQTPLSGSLWHILRWLHLLRHHDLDVSHMGSMTEARQMLAMAFIPGRESRDFRALRWTMESLTEDAEFEQFVNGIPGFLRSKSAMNSCGVTAIAQLLADRATGLGSRILSLLATCQDPQALPSYVRQRRALSCLAAVWCLATLNPDINKWTVDDWESRCDKNAIDVLMNFLHDKDSTISNSAFYTMTVLVHQLLWKFAALPQVSIQDLDLQSHAHAVQSASAGGPLTQFLSRIHMMQVRGLEALGAVDWSVSATTRKAHGSLKEELHPAVVSAEAELRRLIVSHRATMPTKAAPTSTTTPASVATPMISLEERQDLTNTRHAVCQLLRLRGALEESRFELLANYVSRLSKENDLSEKGFDTLRQAMFRLPARTPHPQLQQSLANSLHDFVKRWAMIPAIEVLFGIVRHLSDEGSAQTAKNAMHLYQRTSPDNKAANDALTILQKSQTGTITRDLNHNSPSFPVDSIPLAKSPYDLLGSSSGYGPNSLASSSSPSPQ
jgi:hypothetical protein